MSTHGDLPFDGALEAVQRVETELAERDTSRATADRALTRAREEADQLIAAARAAGDRAGEARRAALMAEADEEVRAIRARGSSDAAKLRHRVGLARDQLVRELTDVVLGTEE